MAIPMTVAPSRSSACARVPSRYQPAAAAGTAAASARLSNHGAMVAPPVGELAFTRQREGDEGDGAEQQERDPDDRPGDLGLILGA